MIAKIELQGVGEAVAKAIQDKATLISRSVDGTTVSVVAAGNRGGRLNALIAAVQAGRKRSPWYINKEAMEAIRFALRGLASGSASTRFRALDTIGKLMLESVARNVEKQQNPDGSRFTPLTPEYAHYKRRRFGFIAPILKATNDLLGGLRVRITKDRA